MIRSAQLNVMGLTLGIALASSPAMATNFDGSEPLLCVSIETAECGAGEKCLQGTAESINVPQFFRINFEGKEINATRPDGTKLTTKIENMHRLEDRVILQGMENSLGWSMSITRESGKMAITASGDAVGFIIFGVCTALEGG